MLDEENRNQLLVNAKIVLSGIGSDATPSILLFVHKRSSLAADELAAEILENMNNTSNLAVIVRQRKAKPSQFKTYLSEELGKINSSRIIESLLPMLKDTNWEVRNEVIVALSRINQRTDLSDRIIEPIVEMLEVEDNELARNSAVQLIKELGETAINVFVKSYIFGTAQNIVNLDKALLRMLNGNRNSYDYIRFKLKAQDAKSNVNEIVNLILNYIYS
jgi:hypothetical protein